jgi:hypothetical protein
MSNLVDINRLQFQKIFEAHQQKSTLSYTDALKICSSLKIFPDLLSSQEIRKIFITLSSSESGAERMSFLQFESFLKIIAKQAFNHAKQKSDDYGNLIMHIKETSQKRYGTSLECSLQKGRSLSKTMTNRSSKATVSTPKGLVKNSFFQKTSEKTLQRSKKSRSPIKLATSKVKGLVNLLSPGLRTLKSRLDTQKSSALTERRDGHCSACSTSPSPCKPNLISKISKVFTDFQLSCKKIDTHSYSAQQKVKTLFAINKQRKERTLLCKMAFSIWKLSVKFAN